MAIGAQNIYVLKRGLLKESVFIVALTCSLIDGILIIAGVKGLGKFLQIFPSFITYITWFGIVFLCSYGLLALKSSFKDHALHVSEKSSKKSIFVILSTIFSLSFLNPHVYIDTVLLIGTIGSKYDGISQNLFTFGAVSASFIWFFGLAYGSRILIPLFKKPFTWKCLDFFTAIIMFFIAFNLFSGM